MASDDAREELARLICEAQDIDPDEHWRGYDLSWAQFKPAADALLAAGYEKRTPAGENAGVAEALDCLIDLVALVRGECPSLLNEDSGGDADLDWRICQALAAARASRARVPYLTTRSRIEG